MNNYTELLARLRHCGDEVFSAREKLMIADAIEKLAAENESLKASVYGVYELERQLAFAQARIQELRDALFFPDISPMIEECKKQLAAAQARIQELREALKVAEEFVDRHSEPWYISGQADLAHIRKALSRTDDTKVLKEFVAGGVE